MKRQAMLILAAMLFGLAVYAAMNDFATRLAHGAPNQCAALENTLNDLVGTVGEMSGFHMGLAARAAGASQLTLQVVASRMRDAEIVARVEREWAGKVAAKREAVLLFSGCR